MLAASFLMAFLGASVTVPIKPAAEIDLAGREVRLGEVADLRRLDGPTRRRLESRIIARVPAGSSSVGISRAGLAKLIRRSVPGLEPITSNSDGIIIFRAAREPKAGEGPGRSCASLAAPLAAGETVAPSDLTQVPCEGAATRGLIRFDRSDGVARAVTSLPAGTRLGRISVPEVPAIGAGDKLTLVSTVGPVRIERSVVALQPGRTGGRLFVLAPDGEVISAPIAATAAPEEQR